MLVRNAYLKLVFFVSFLAFLWWVNPFYVGGLFLPPEIIRKNLIFWCFQGLLKENIGMKWVNSDANENSYCAFTADNNFISLYVKAAQEIIWKMISRIVLNNSALTLSWHRSLSYRNQSIDLLMDCFPYYRNLRREIVKK